MSITVSDRSCEVHHWRWGGKVYANPGHFRRRYEWASEFLDAGHAAARASYDGPVPRCEDPHWLVCSTCSARRMNRCNKTSMEKCVHCGEVYRRRCQRVAQSGLRAGAVGTEFVVTLTAPGAEAHSFRSGKRCPCTPEGGINLARWNGEMVGRWNRFQQALRRELGVDFQYFKCVEVQKRKALHMHPILRFDRAVQLSEARVRRLAIHHGFGHSVKVRAIHGADNRPARYVAKYVAKSAADRQAVPYVHPTTGAIGPGRWRTWTASRAWGSTMAAIKAEQKAWAIGAARALLTPAQGLSGAEGAAFKENPVRYTLHTSPAERRPV